MAISNSSSSSAVSLPSNIMTSAQYQAQQSALAAAQSTSMGQGAFLTLFTTQLKNQDPTDPVKNEAFVAQLAQFSQLEATTAMKTSMDSMASSMSNDRLLGAASLIGKSVTVPNGPVTVTSTTVSQGTINLPTGADGVTLNVYDSTGALVKTQTYGAQKAGTMTLSWDGTDNSGKAVANGTYSYSVSAVSGGQTITPAVSTLATVQSVSSSGTTGAMLLNVGGGKTVDLSTVTNISQ
jgi:flagellar basal-body rod modification protein FlgD